VGVRGRRSRDSLVLNMTGWMCVVPKGDPSMQRKLKFSRLRASFAICRLPAKSSVPDWALCGDFFSITSTAQEVSIVCKESQVPLGNAHEGGWTCLKLEGPFAFSETGILSSFIRPLAEKGVPIFALSTFDTDYVLVKQESLEEAVATLLTAGHEEVAVHR
jgi:uncharacterized protein